MASRALARLRALAQAASESLAQRASARPGHPERILVLHELLLGDTLMLAPLLAQLRARHADATIFVAARREALPLFSAAPYGVVALPYSERDSNALDALALARGCDLALVPGDNRYAIVARALGARWVVALHDSRRRKNRFVDERVAWPDAPTDLADIFASLAGPAQRETYRVGDWPAPAAAPFDAPETPYVLLHVGASTPLKHWPAERWAQLAERLEEDGLRVVFSAGAKESRVIEAIDPARRYRSYAGTLDLAQLWSLVAHADAEALRLDASACVGELRSCVVVHVVEIDRHPTGDVRKIDEAMRDRRRRARLDAPVDRVEIAVGREAHLATLQGQ